MPSQGAFSSDRGTSVCHSPSPGRLVHAGLGIKGLERSSSPASLPGDRSWFLWAQRSTTPCPRHTARQEPLGLAARL